MKKSAAILVCLPILILACMLPAHAQTSHLNPPDQSADRPDAGFVDANSDGIDGMRVGPVFVSPLGLDSNPGTFNAPMKSLGAAILAAKGLTPVRDVYVASRSGAFEESVVFVDGVSVYGGYDDITGWTRSAAPATINGGPTGAWVTATSQPLTLNLLSINAADNPTTGGHSIALIVEGASTTTLERVSLIAREGGAGAPGASGIDGIPGSNGSQGGGGSCDGGTPGQGGVGGGPLQTLGGAGGRGGNEGSNSGVQGQAGTGANPGMGGFGGSGGTRGDPGGNGGTGGNGVLGLNGNASNDFFGVGGDGTNGTDGSGGGYRSRLAGC